MPEAHCGKSPAEHREPEKAKGDDDERDSSPLTGCHSQRHANRHGRDADEPASAYRQPRAPEHGDCDPANRQTRYERPCSRSEPCNVQPVVMNGAADAYKDKDTYEVK